MDNDAIARRTALDASRSFIVRAPAGSGKTELLIQRFLVLLADVTVPEQIVAITFTRKAAAEMRERIIQQLQAALTDLPIDAPPHRQLSWRLARAVLAQDQAQQWHLLAKPERLRLVTIDALCADLVRQLPLASGLMQVNIHQQPSELYAAAVQALFQDLDMESPWQHALTVLLTHSDNRLDHLSQLCQALLAQREQWLPLMAEASDNPLRLKQLLEANFQAISVALMVEVDRLLSAEVKAALLPRLALAAELCGKQQARFQCFSDLTAWPAPIMANQVFWQVFAQFLLTTEGALRQRLDVNSGFPAASKAPDKVTKVLWQSHKDEMQGLLADLREQVALLPALQHCAIAPPAVFDQQEWPLCQAIFSLLPALLIYWRQVCEGEQQIDFAEVSWRARNALGNSDNPTDLALQLDYQVQHWLIDEFQDTSLAQYDLLSTLTAGWQVDDGRTVFIVGDPLQSIYRFRQAEVSLFWQVWHGGLNGLPVTPLCLTHNFRSQPALIDWFNEHFTALFPIAANWSVGAVPYTPVTAALTTATIPAVIEVAITESPSEAEAIVAILLQELATGTASIALLVKARSHLTALLPLLQQHNIAYRAVELASLIQQPVVQDLLCLLRALLNRDDRLNWAAVLRAPWGGALSLPDWQRLLGDKSQSFVWPLSDVVLSDIGTKSVQRLQPILAEALAQRHRQSLSTCLGQAWFALGGNDYWPTSAAAIEKFFALLRKTERAGDLVDFTRFERLLATTYLEETVTARLEIMTVHKAKGLEFDVVILPGLARRQAADDSPLFVFDSLCTEAGIRWLLAPMKAADVKQEPRYDYLRAIQKQKRQHEQQRLFYVACTRARQRLYLLNAD